MRLSTLLRTNSGAWLALPLGLLTVLYLGNYGLWKIADAYGTALAAAATAPLGFVAPICAALGAWESGRLRRAGVWGGPHVRGTLAITIQHLAPVIAAGTLAIGAGTALNASAAGWPHPDLRPLVVSMAVIAGHSLAGFAVGRWVPVVIAAPAVMLASFAWMVLLRVFEPLWLRHLNGLSLELCCDASADLAPNALVAAVAVATGLGLASLILIAAQRWRSLVLPTAMIPLALGLGLGTSLVSDLGSDPVVARDRRLLVCADRSSGPRVCLWPEHREQLDEVAAIASGAFARWSRFGLPVPDTVSAGGPLNVAAEGELLIGLSGRSGPIDILNGVAYAMLPPWPPCADVEPYPGADAIDFVLAWLLTEAGMPAEQLAVRFPDVAPPDPALFPDADPSPRPQIRDTVARVRALSPDRQRAWVERNLQAIAACALEPRLAPGT